jgi:RNA polymerase sigma-70 factor (ECF subfamily)
VSKREGAEAALALVEQLGDRLSGYFYYHGLRGALLKQLGRGREARVAFDRAIALATNTAEAAYIRKELDHLAGETDSAHAEKRQEII